MRTEKERLGVVKRMACDLFSLTMSKWFRPLGFSPHDVSNYLQAKRLLCGTLSGFAERQFLYILTGPQKHRRKATEK